MSGPDGPTLDFSHDFKFECFVFKYPTGDYFLVERTGAGKRSRIWMNGFENFVGYFIYDKTDSYESSQKETAKKAVYELEIIPELRKKAQEIEEQEIESMCYVDESDYIMEVVDDDDEEEEEEELSMMPGVVVECCANYGRQRLKKGKVYKVDDYKTHEGVIVSLHGMIGWWDFRTFFEFVKRTLKEPLPGKTIGEWVRCIEGTKASKLKNGQNYVVEETVDELIRLKGCSFWVPANKFKIVDDQWAIGKKVRFINIANPSKYGVTVGKTYTISALETYDGCVELEGVDEYVFHRQSLQLLDDEEEEVESSIVHISDDDKENAFAIGEWFECIKDVSPTMRRKKGLTELKEGYQYQIADMDYSIEYGETMVRVKGAKFWTSTDYFEPITDADNEVEWKYCMTSGKPVIMSKSTLEGFFDDLEEIKALYDVKEAWLELPAGSTVICKSSSGVKTLKKDVIYTVLDTKLRGDSVMLWLEGFKNWYSICHFDILDVVTEYESMTTLPGANDDDFIVSIGSWLIIDIVSNHGFVRKMVKLLDVYEEGEKSFAVFQDSVTREDKESFSLVFDDFQVRRIMRKKEVDEEEADTNEDEEEVEDDDGPNDDEEEADTTDDDEEEEVDDEVDEEPEPPIEHMPYDDLDAGMLYEMSLPYADPCVRNLIAVALKLRDKARSSQDYKLSTKISDMLERFGIIPNTTYVYGNSSYRRGAYYDNQYSQEWWERNGYMYM